MSNIFIISGPSGAGEDSVIDGLQKIFPIERVVTTTTRKMRPGESQKNPYYFISEKEFISKIEKGGFFEYAKEYNNLYYGVTGEEIERVKSCGRIGIWKIEYKGVITAKKVMPDIIAIFINAPLKILEERIRRRTSVTDEFVAERMKYTKEWLKHKNIYDYEIENKQGKLDETIKKVANIIEKHTMPEL